MRLPVASRWPILLFLLCLIEIPPLCAARVFSPACLCALRLRITNSCIEVRTHFQLLLFLESVKLLAPCVGIVFVVIRLLSLFSLSFGCSEWLRCRSICRSGVDAFTSCLSSCRIAWVRCFRSSTSTIARAFSKRQFPLVLVLCNPKLVMTFSFVFHTVRVGLPFLLVVVVHSNIHSNPHLSAASSPGAS